MSNTGKTCALASNQENLILAKASNGLCAVMKLLVIVEKSTTAKEIKVCANNWTICSIELQISEIKRFGSNSLCL